MKHRRHYLSKLIMSRLWGFSKVLRPCRSYGSNVPNMISVFAMRLISSMHSVTLHISNNVTKHARHSLIPEVDNMVILMKI